MHERVLSVLAMRPVDDVVMDAPWVISEEFCRTLDISAVFHATFAGADDFEEERFAYPKEAGLHHELPRPVGGLTVDLIIDTIIGNQMGLVTQHTRKTLKENVFYSTTLPAKTSEHSTLSEGGFTLPEDIDEET